MENLDIKDIKVGIADAAIATSPDRLITIGLGSCIGIAFYDNMTKIGALLHIMLPDSTQFAKVTNPLKFADIGIPKVVDDLRKKGANVNRLTAKIAGGASMFNFSDKSMIMDIGNRNSKAVKSTLSKMNIRLIGEDVGGSKGRTMILNTLNGVVEIRTVGLGAKEL